MDSGDLSSPNEIDTMTSFYFLPDTYSESLATYVCNLSMIWLSNKQCSKWHEIYEELDLALSYGNQEGWWLSVGFDWDSVVLLY